MPSSQSSNSNSSAYPYTRSEECCWSPEECAERLSSLTLKKEEATHELLHHGWKSKQISYLRGKFGSNVIGGGDDDDDGKSDFILFQKIPFLKPILSALKEQLVEPLIIMLLFSAGISILLGNTSDAISIAIALLIVSLVAAIQEYRSEQALEKLANLVPPTCTVVRDNQSLDRFPAKELVIGDVVVLRTGDRIPADCRVVESVEIKVDESSLTGENEPVVKIAEPLPFLQNHQDNNNTYSNVKSSIPVTQQTNVVFAGTLVISGRGRAIVVAVGDNTEFGQISAELKQVESRKSPLQNKIDELGKRLAYASSVAIAVIALIGLILGRPFLETLTVAVSLAVAAIPEGLPICTTVTLALGVLRMSKRNAIVKKLPVVESLGCATVVASDKTGTLTQNEMTARAAYTLAFPKKRFGLTGVGYKSTMGTLIVEQDDEFPSRSATTSVIDGGAVRHTINRNCDEFPAIDALLQTACLCNNATVICDLDSSMSEGHTGGAMSGQPTELALLVGAEKVGIPDPRPLYHRISEIPFSSDRKRMEVRASPINGMHQCQAFQICTAHANLKKDNQPKHMTKRQSDNDGMYFIKGMPESVLAECKSHVASDGSSEPLDADKRSLVLAQSRRMAGSGLRVLAMAYGTSLDELVFAGTLGMEDPPRHGVADSVWQLRRGGVRVLMVTGDSKETALAIARRCGIVGSESDRLSLSDSLSNGDSGRSDGGDGPMSDVELGSSSDQSISGSDLDIISPQNLIDSISNVKVFYRVAPRHKLAIVRALQAHGDIVAMTGDGKLFYLNFGLE